MLVEFLQREQNDALWAIASFLDQGKIHEAAKATGGLSAINAFLATLHPQPKPMVEDEPPFVDPATIQRPKTKVKK